MLIRKLARQFGAGGRESKSEDYVQTIFKVVATVLVLVFYFYPALVTTDLCNTTDAEIELHLPYGDNLLPTNAVVLCGHDYAIIANSYILWVVIAGAVHWILASWFWTRSKEFRGVWNISVGWNIIFFAIMLIQSTSLSSHRYADLKNYWWVWLYLGFEILIWLYLIFYALYAWYSLRVARRQRYNLRDLDVQPLPFASQRDADVQYDPLTESSHSVGIEDLHTVAAFRFSYRAAFVETIFGHLLRSCLSTIGTFEYVGELDAEGQPHGFGRWNDSQQGGESMRGFWQHGEPNGPFISTEVGTGNGFASVHIAVASVAGSEFLTAEPGLQPPTDVFWGVAAVETSTSGTFLSHLPSISLVAPPEAGRTAAWALEHVLKMPDRHEAAKITITLSSAGSLQVLNHRPLPELADFRRRSTESAAATVGIDESACTSSVRTAGTDGTTARRGSASRHHKGVTRVIVELMDEEPIEMSAQQVALTDSTKGPVLMHLRDSANFSNLSSISNPQRVAASHGKTLGVVGWERKVSDTALVFVHGFVGHATCLKAFGQFLNLARPPAHITPVAFVWPSGEGLVNSRDGICAYARLRDDSCTEPLLAKFESFLQSLYDAGIRTVHFIAHSLGNRLLCCALPRIRHLFELSAQPNADEPMVMATCALLHPAYSLRKFVQVDYAILRALCEHITLYIDTNDNAQWAPELFYDHEPSLGLHPYALVEKLPEPGDSYVERLYGYKTRQQLRLADDGSSTPLDLDVVDTSFIDSNVEANRHGFWNVNRFIVDDLLEIMTKQQRACFRQHRLTRSGRYHSASHSNVWTFLAAPRRIGTVSD